jgi:hypothetical protein
MAERTRDVNQVSRRRFLGVAWGASLVALVTQGGVAFVSFFSPRPGGDAFGGTVTAGRVEEFPKGSISHV